MSIQPIYIYIYKCNEFSFESRSELLRREMLVTHTRKGYFVLEVKQPRRPNIEDTPHYAYSQNLNTLINYYCRMSPMCVCVLGLYSRRDARGLLRHGWAEWGRRSLARKY